MRIFGIGPDSGPFYIPALVVYNKLYAPISFIIDTGADQSLISYVDALKLGIDFSKSKEEVLVVGIFGQTRLHLLRDVQLGFLTNNRKDPLYLLHLPQMGVVVESQALWLPSILGVDVLRNFSLHFDLKQKLMYLQTEDVHAAAVKTKDLLAKLDEQELAKRYSYLGYPNEFVKNLCMYLDNKLRAFFPKDRPQKELEVEHEVEKLLIARDYEYKKQAMSFQFSSKVYRPDFVFESERTVLEIKLCKSDRREKEIIDEIGSDITAYKSKFDHLVFLVYDLGIISNPVKFKHDIERTHSNTLLLIVQG